MATLNKLIQKFLTIPDKSPLNNVYVNMVRNVLIDFLAGEED